MKQLAWTLPLLVVGVACDPSVEPINTVRNDIIVAGDMGARTVQVDSIQVRLRGEDETELTLDPSGDFGGNILSAPAGAATNLGVDCDEQADCPADGGGVVNRCTGGSCWAFQEISTSDVECGIYDVRFTAQGGATCEVVIGAGADGSAAGTACSITADCGGPFRCIDGTCQYSYAGDGLYLCYVAERWDLSNHIDDGSCPDFFP